MSTTDKDGEPITFKRVRRRLTTLIEALPSATAGDASTRILLANVTDDLKETRAWLDQLCGDYK